jgi:hypothetical protein
MEDLRQYLTDLRTKIHERDLGSFWVISDRADFRPIKNTTKGEIKRLLKEKAQYYKNKRIAEIRVYINPKHIDTEDAPMSIIAIIYQIDEEGQIEHKSYSDWGSRINFYPKDFAKIKFSLKLVETIMRLANDKTMVTNTLTGMKYKDYVKALKKKNIAWDL